MRAAMVLLACQALALGQGPPPESLRAMLLEARQHAGEHLDSRDATPELTRIKHGLRDWIESHLTPLTRPDEDTVLAFELNAELRKGGLACADHCPEQNLIGFLGDIKIRRSGGFLIVQTGAGIQCGNDEAAYIYQWKADRWQQFWENEQNDSRKDKYQPQRLRAVLISSPETGHVIVTVGTNPWCSSNLQPVYHRIWRVKVGGPPALLLDEGETEYIAEPVSAAAWPNGVLIEYAVFSIDTGVHSRREIRHYILT
jgi:hypothetical protein